MFSMSVDRVLLNQVCRSYIKNQKTLPPMYLFLISIFCFVRLLLLFHNQDTNSSSAPKQVCRTCRFRILSFPTMHQPVVGSRAKKGASNSQSLEDPLLSSCRHPLLLRRPRLERPSSCTAVKRPSSLCGVFRGEGCEEEEKEEAGTLCMCVCILRGRHEAAAARCKQQ